MTTTTSVSEVDIPSPTVQNKRGCFFYVRRGLLSVVLLPFMLIASGFVYETIMEAGDAERYPPPGQLVDVDGYAMHIYCVGEGSLTIIMESGSGGFIGTPFPTINLFVATSECNERF